MPALAALLPACRTELLIRPLGDDGRYVVKDPRSGEFFQLGGEAEYFLLTQLDGRRTAGAVCAAYAERFGEPLSRDDLAGFVELARSEGFVRDEGGSPVRPAAGRASSTGARVSGTRTASSRGSPPGSGSSGRRPSCSSRPRALSRLC